MLHLNGEEVVFGRFPNKELNLPIKGLNILNLMNVVKFSYEDNEDLIKLALLKQWLDEMKAPCLLYITYLPYSRMDRVNGVYSISLKAISSFINNLDFHIKTGENYYE